MNFFWSDSHMMRVCFCQNKIDGNQAFQCKQHEQHATLDISEQGIIRCLIAGCCCRLLLSFMELPSSAATSALLAWHTHVSLCAPPPPSPSSHAPLCGVPPLTSLSSPQIPCRTHSSTCLKSWQNLQRSQRKLACLMGRDLNKTQSNPITQCAGCPSRLASLPDSSLTKLVLHVPRSFQASCKLLNKENLLPHH